VNIRESEQFKQELRFIALHIKRDKRTASIKFVQHLKTAIQNIPSSPYQYRQSIYYENPNIRDMIHQGYTVVYEINSEDNILEILTIFNQNLPDLPPKIKA